MEFKILSIFISFILGLLVVLYIRRYDIYEKEPYFSLLLTTILGGSIAVLISLAAYQGIEAIGISNKYLRTFYGAFIFIGPIEEVSKFIGFIVCYYLIFKKRMNEINDGIIYMAGVALGFSLIENYLYANNIPDGQYLLIFRLFISSPVHIAVSSFIGLAAFKVLIEKKKIKLIVLAILWASLFHGLFDGILSIGYLSFFAIFILVLIVQQAMVLIRLTNSISPYKIKFNEWIAKGGIQSISATVCPNCKTKDNHTVYRLRDFGFYQCTNCEYSFTDKRNLARLFKYFAPEFRTIKSMIFRNRMNEDQRYTLKNCVFFENKDSNSGYFMISELENYFNTYKWETVEKYYISRISPAHYFAGY